MAPPAPPPPAPHPPVPVAKEFLVRTAWILTALVGATPLAAQLPPIRVGQTIRDSLVRKDQKFSDASRYGELSDLRELERAGGAGRVPPLAGPRPRGHAVR